MLARFFIDRPVLAWVISIVIILLGAIAAGFLPVAEYPEITPPTVRVTANYPGANARVVADTVAAPIEQQVVGVEGMLYMTSQSNNDGSYTLDTTFALGTDVNLAQVLVQNRVAIAEPTLPDVVRAIGVTTKKRSPDILLGISLYSDDNPETGRPYYDALYLSNYATIQIKDAVARLEGVGDVTILGQQDYSMRVWTPGVAHTVAIPGTSFVLNANSSSYSNIFVILKPFDERRDPSLTGEAIAGRIRARLQREVLEARVLVFGAPAVRGLGNAGGFKLMVEATGDVNFDALQARADNLAVQGNQQPGLIGLFNGFRARTPQLYADIDRTKAKTMGVPLTDVFDALQAYLGSYYVNDFNRFGRTWQVNVQADARFRVDAETVKQLKVRNADGDMVPLGSVIDIRDSAGPVTITRYNMFPAATVTGASLPGVSTGDVLRTMEALAAKELPRSMTYEWTELSYFQKQSSKVGQLRDLRQNPFSAFVLGAVLVFFVLAGLYESWSLPLAVVLVVPMCLLSALTGIALAGMDVNIFVQVGFVVLVGLACKNAILIVEFARDRQQEGATRFNAAVEAAQVRLRPIVMTSFAFILGVLPLAVAQGAGAEMRRTLGTAVFAGMIGVTLFGLFLTPVFYSVVRWFSDREAVKPALAHGPDAVPAEAIPDGPADSIRQDKLTSL